MDRDPVDDGEDVVTTTETEPVYNYKAWNGSEAANGMQCCKNGAYCFLCDNIVLDEGGPAEDDDDDIDEDDPDGSIRDDVIAINNYITIMVRSPFSPDQCSFSHC